ncbi:acetoacetyl-CoA synthetase [Photobacterium aphoticum]|uniref:Acetoacetyl-CoA synthetase n=1 Tax=Photobacterium aphoticum TaxID=754436 RepID=A0A090R6V8_9GAMM|nr:acetoacetyl-CoA synthetase [Photobacterium aphoticum]
MTAHNDSTPPSATPPATLSPTILWTPSPERVQTSLLKRFMHHLESCEHGTYSAHGPFANYAALHRWSIENSPLFWDTLWDFCNVIGAKKPPVTYCDPSSTTPAKDTLWFPHAKLNYAENLLTHWQQHADHPALTAYREGQTDNPDIMTWQTLYQHTAQLAQYLHHAGVGKGDVVAGYLPIFPTPSSPCWRPVHLARYGHPLPPISGSTAWSNASDKPPPKCCSLPMATPLMANPITCMTKSPPLLNNFRRSPIACRCLIFSLMRTSRKAHRHSPSPTIQRFPSNAGKGLSITIMPRSLNWVSRPSLSIIPCVFCIPPAPPVNPNASCTPWAVLCSTT